VPTSQQDSSLILNVFLYFLPGLRQNVNVVHIAEGEDAYVTTTVYDQKTGLPRRQQTRLNQMLHSPPDGTPSEVLFDDDGQAHWFTWHQFNLEHRENGPSTVVLHPGTQIPMTEVFRLEGQPRPPELGPYRLRFDESGEVVNKEFSGPDDQMTKGVIQHQRNRLEP